MFYLRAVVASALLAAASAVDPTVQLNYTTYQGTALPGGITQWLGIRYAAPPLGDLRFAAPQDPVVNDTVQIADAHGQICLGTGASPTAVGYSEDCLFLDVYAPSNASNLPVFFFIQGGGFNTNSNANYNGSGLIQASGGNIIIVNFNYRVGPYGFLPGSEVLAGGSLNNGLKDQLKALEWVQQYIEQFGGNPNHVTIGGDSAGAASVTLLLTAYGGKDLGLFHAAAAESQSFATVLNNSQSQFMYDNLVIRTGCASSNDTLACLRSLTAVELQQQNFNTPLPGAQQPPLYMYGPTLDHDLIQYVTYDAFTLGAFQKIPVIMGDDTNGGTIFTPKQTSNYSQSDIFLQDQFPFLSLAQLAEINELYPVNGTPTFPDSGPFWRQVSNAYGDMRYTCPGLYISSMYRKNGVGSSWNYLWNVTDPTQVAEGYGVPHTVEVNAIFGPANTNGGAPASYYPGQINAAIVPVVQSYWTSFIRSYNPNTYRLAGTPLWAQWTETAMRRLVFATNNTANAKVDDVKQMQCAYFNSIGAGLQQ